MICMLTSPDPPDLVVIEDPPDPPDLVTDLWPPDDPPSISNVVTVLVLVISTSYSS